MLRIPCDSHRHCLGRHVPAHRTAARDVVRHPGARVDVRVRPGAFRGRSLDGRKARSHDLLSVLTPHISSPTAQRPGQDSELSSCNAPHRPSPPSRATDSSCTHLRSQDSAKFAQSRTCSPGAGVPVTGETTSAQAGGSPRRWSARCMGGERGRGGCQNPTWLDAREGSRDAWRPKSLVDS
jgi:hypothetical protein